MLENTIAVLTKLLFVDTPEAEHEEKLAIILNELKIYQTKQGVLQRPIVWKNADTVVPFQWWDQYGGNDMPTATRYMVLLQACKPNQTEAERGFKAYKYVNSKTRNR